MVRTAFILCTCRVSELQIQKYLKYCLGEAPRPLWGCPAGWGAYLGGEAHNTSCSPFACEATSCSHCACCLSVLLCTNAAQGAVGGDEDSQKGWHLSAHCLACVQSCSPGLWTAMCPRRKQCAAPAACLGAAGRRWRKSSSRWVSRLVTGRVGQRWGELLREDNVCA